MLKVANRAVRAYLMLAINGGFGQTDLATLEKGAVDYSAGRIDMYRNKTGVRRIIPLWSETV